MLASSPLAPASPRPVRAAIACQRGLTSDYPNDQSSARGLGFDERRVPRELPEPDAVVGEVGLSLPQHGAAACGALTVDGAAAKPGSCSCGCAGTVHERVVARVAGRGQAGSRLAGEGLRV